MEQGQHKTFFHLVLDAFSGITLAAGFRVGPRATMQAHAFPQLVSRAWALAEGEQCRCIRAEGHVSSLACYRVEVSPFGQYPKEVLPEGECE